MPSGLVLSMKANLQGEPHFGKTRTLNVEREKGILQMLSKTNSDQCININHPGGIPKGLWPLVNFTSADAPSFMHVHYPLATIKAISQSKHAFEKTKGFCREEGWTSYGHVPVQKEIY